MFKPHASCKICGLPEDLLKQVHYWRFVENMPVHKIAERLNDVITEKQLQIPKFYPTGVSRHFKRHLSPELVAAYVQKLPPHLNRAASSVPVGKTSNIEEHLASIIAPENLEVFERLKTCMTDLSNHLETINSILPTKEDIKSRNYEDLIVDLRYTYDVYVRLTKELRSTLHSLSSFLNLKSVMRTFVEELLREYTHRVMSAFLEEMRYLKDELSPEDQVTTIIIKEVSTSFAAKLANATDQIIDKFDRIIKSQDL